MVRVTHEVLAGWNLVVVAAVLLLVVINKQLFPRQFRQLLTVPGGVAHTNQLLREWTPTKSFIGYSFNIAYILITALFLQKAAVIFSSDVYAYNGFHVFSVLCACITGWVLLRYLALTITGWLFQHQELVIRQITIDLSASTYGFIFLSIILLLVLYIPNSMFIWLGIGIFFVIALMRLFFSFFDTRVFSKMPSFYIFLYFCTLEIAPTILLLVAGLRFFTKNTVL
ncbi:MAG: DUF4271 domain-containing protein [Bacteroidales bacterium]|nr:DUF4271 domain-containing protein [Bacteroidales bacterium]